MSENYNIFKVLKFERKETIHSAMITAIASHDEKSQNAFFEMLSKAINTRSQKFIDNKIEFNVGLEKLKETIDRNNDEHLWIDNEVHLIEKIKNETGEIVYRDRGRADIWIGTNNYYGKDIDNVIEKYRLIIENKINADPQDYQLRRYYRYLKEDGFSRKFGGLFMLCVDVDDENTKKAINSANHFPTESKWNDDIQDKTQFAIITYKDDIIPWLKEVINNATEDFRKVVSDYLNLVESLYPDENKTIKNNQKEPCNDYEYIEITVTDEDGYGWDYPIDHILDNALFGSKERQLDYLNDIIHDIEHYRDCLNALDPSNERFKQQL